MNRKRLKINIRRYPMEMHIVHRNTAYSNFSLALEHEDGVVVIAIFFQVKISLMVFELLI